MINQIIKFLTTKKVERECLVCKNKFISTKYKSFFLNRLTTVVQVYCSKKCDKKMHLAIRKFFRNKRLTKEELEITKNIRYVDF